MLIAISAQGCSANATTQFEREFEAGADCERLFELRNEAKHGASDALQEEMNTSLRSVQCFSTSSKRAPAGPPNTGRFTVQEYRLYRELISSPSSVAEAKATDKAAHRLGVPPAVAGDAADRVMEELSKNNWFASPDAEIRHASDWNGEKQ